MKAPLTAVIYAALLQFAAVFLPFSPGYAEARAAFSMPILGYIFLVVYCLWVSLIPAMIYGNAKDSGIKLMLVSLLAFLGATLCVPLLEPVFFGEITGLMTRADLLLTLAGCASSGLLLMLLDTMLFKAREPAKPAAQKIIQKFKLKKLDLAIKLLVLPVIYCVIYFLAWYFLLWRAEAVRVYYTQSPELRPFINEIINMLLDNARLVPMALLRGLLMTVAVLPLLFQLPGKRAMFIVITVMLFLSPAVMMLVPNPVMPQEVRIPHLIEAAAAGVLYGGLAGFMLHTSLRREAVAAQVPAARKPAAAKPSAEQSAAAKPAGKPAEAGAAKK